MILSKLAALALAATSTGQETEVDASAVRSATELTERIKEAGAQPVIVTGAALDGQDMRRMGRMLKGGCIFDSSFKGTDWSGTVAPVLRAQTGEMVPLFRIRGDRLLMRYSGNMGDTPDKAQDSVSCGARAGIVDLRDLGE